MFKGSKNVEPEGHPSYISSVGGQSNAYTTEDATVFWETVPSQYLPLVLWLEADRMASLRIDDKTFRTEREVVKEERRMRVENQPYGRLQEIISDQAFTVHPYKHPGDRQHGGSRRGVDRRRARLLPDLLRAEQRDRGPRRRLRSEGSAVARHAVPRARAEVRQVRCRATFPKEPPQTKERRVHLEEAWPLPAVVVAHHITYDGNPDSYPLHVASKILSDGQSSRIYRKLVYETGIALAAFGGGNIIEDPNLFFAVAIVQPGHTPDEAEKALIAELDKLRNGAGLERRAAAGQEPVRARLHPAARVGSEQSGGPGPRGDHPQRHQDRRWRVRYLPEPHGRGRPARGEDLLHAGEPARADDHAQGTSGPQPEAPR